MVKPLLTSSTSSTNTSTRRRAGLFAVGILSPVGVLVLAAVLAGSRGATAADVDGPPPDGTYRNVTVEGRVVPVIRVKENGAMVLVDTDGKQPRTWEELYKQHGDLPSGTYNLHKTAPNGSDNFAEVPVDRKGIWIIDAKGNITAR
jgi:hypothetical protein